MSALKVAVEIISMLLPASVVINDFELNKTHCALLIPAEPVAQVPPVAPELPVHH